MKEEALRALLKAMVPLIKKTARVTATDDQQEPIDPEMVTYWEFCLANQYAMAAYVKHLNSEP